MTSYTKATDFAIKDTLLTGNPAKLVSGAEIDAEFTALEAADATSVKGAGSSTDNAIARFNGIDGYLLQNSGITISDSDVITGAASASDRADTPVYGQVQDSTSQWITSISGTNTITGTLTPAITAYTAGQVFRFVAAGANTGAVTINLNGLGAKSVTKLGSTALVSGDIVSGSIVNITYDGTRFQLKSDASAPDATDTSKGIVELATAAEVQAGTDTTRVVTPAGLASSFQSVEGSFKNLVLSANGTSANVVVTADEIVVKSSSNQYRTLRTVSLTIAGTTTGANALDTGTIATSTWYSVWVIWNGTTTAGLLSTSATAPTLPSGYTHKARVGWMRTDGTANKYPLAFNQYGNRIQYALTAASNVVQYPTMASGVQGTWAAGSYVWVAIATANYIPPTASSIKLLLGSAGGTAYVLASPNNVPSAGYNGAVQPIVTTGTNTGNAISVSGDMALESSNIYYIGNAASAWMQCIGWEDKL